MDMILAFKDKHFTHYLLQAGLNMLMMLALTSCGSSSKLTEPTDVCTGYPDWQTSAYILPYQPGQRLRVDPGQLRPQNHNLGVNKYA